jgi:hypothetical protein
VLEVPLYKINKENNFYGNTRFAVNNIESIELLSCQCISRPNRNVFYFPLSKLIIKFTYQ